DDVEDIICYVKTHDDPTHPGEKRLRETLQQRYYHIKLRYTIDRFKCEHCQRHKLSGRGYGLLPEREMRIAPWEEVAIDLIGPWNIKVNGTASHIRSKFIQSWLSRYPRPMRCVHDQGGEFIGSEFQWLLNMFSVKDVSSTSKNPQSNSICERMHQTVGNILRTELYSNPPQNMTQARDIIDQALATAMHATRTTIATTLGSTPGALAFSRDMFLNIPLIADWTAIHAHREQFVNENLRRANRKRRQYDYAPGQQVLKKVHDPTKLGVRTSGPYTIERVHVNGTVTIELRQGVTERINIRRLIPYR
ncbi:hypothetical protein ACHAXR_004955, partial [Thalassiosira sp. AJA248-18]